MKGPYWTKNWIENLWRFTSENFVDYDSGKVDFEALGREEFEFRKALFYRNFKNSKRAKAAFDEASEFYKSHVECGKKGGRPRKETTADGDIREDSQDRKSGTSANNYGDAPRREAGEAILSRESGALAPTTVSMNMRRVPQNEAPAHGFSGGRTAQGTMSRSPEAAAQSGKDYDQETDQVSTDEARQSQARESQRTDGHSLRVGNVARPPVRSPGRNSRCPNSREEFHAFVADNNLHEALAEEWYAIHEARGWVDENGNPIKNWRGALKNFCIKVEQKRRTA